MASPNLILFDPEERAQLLPLAFTRPVCDLRVGILSIREKWELGLGAVSSTLSEHYLSARFPLRTSGDNLFVSGAVCPDTEVMKAIHELKPSESLWSNDTCIASRTKGNRPESSSAKVSFPGSFTRVMSPWHVFQLNGEQLKTDFGLLTSGRKSAPISPSNTVIGGDVFVEEGAKVTASVLNSSEGPIYIGKNAEVMEGCLIRGPFALCEGATLKMGAKIYGPTTIGPYSKVGGEVNNSVILGYSNKAHDGFLGNSVIGEWCNIGAGSNNSNLKNNYANVKVWDYATGDYVNSGTQFCGLFMGDHSKCGINTMFNTGTVVGVSANIFGAGFTPTHIPSFTWGGIEESKEYNVDVAIKVARAVMARRHVELDAESEKILRHVFKITAEDRSKALAS